jgi:hypothetical protein
VNLIPLAVQTGHSRQHKLDTSRPIRSEGATARFKVQCRALHLLNFFLEGGRGRLNNLWKAGLSLGIVLLNCPFETADRPKTPLRGEGPRVP